MLPSTYSYATLGKTYTRPSSTSNSKIESHASTNAPTSSSSNGPLTGKSVVLPHQFEMTQYIFYDSMITDMIRDNPYCKIICQNVEIQGYELYVVEQWACERNLNRAIISFTGNPKHKLYADIVSLPENPINNNNNSKALLSQKNFPTIAYSYINEQIRNSAHLKHTSQGNIFVSNLSSFPSNLNLVPVPKGCLHEIWPLFQVNENLRRTGCGGRSVLSLSTPSTASADKFRQLFKTYEKVPIEYSVRELITLVQIGLFYFDLLRPQYVDGLLCNETMKAVNEWWTSFGVTRFNTKLSDKHILSPQSVSGIIGYVTGVRNRIALVLGNSKTAKDPFDVDSFLESLRQFQKHEHLPRTMRLDMNTIKSLYMLTSNKAGINGTSFNNDEGPMNVVSGDFFGIVKNTMKEVSGKTSQNPLDSETLDIDKLKSGLHGSRARYLWLGRGSPLKPLTSHLPGTASLGIPLESLGPSEFSSYNDSKWRRGLPITKKSSLMPPTDSQLQSKIPPGASPPFSSIETNENHKKIDDDNDANDEFEDGHDDDANEKYQHHQNGIEEFSNEEIYKSPNDYLHEPYSHEEDTSFDTTHTQTSRKHHFRRDKHDHNDGYEHTHKRDRLKKYINRGSKLQPSDQHNFSNQVFQEPQSVMVDLKTPSRPKSDIDNSDSYPDTNNESDLAISETDESAHFNDSDYNPPGSHGYITDTDAEGEQGGESINHTDIIDISLGHVICRSRSEPQLPSMSSKSMTQEEIPNKAKLGSIKSEGKDAIPQSRSPKKPSSSASLSSLASRPPSPKSSSKYANRGKVPTFLVPTDIWNTNTYKAIEFPLYKIAILRRYRSFSLIEDHLDYVRIPELNAIQFSPSPERLEKEYRIARILHRKVRQQLKKFDKERELYHNLDSQVQDTLRKNLQPKVSEMEYELKAMLQRDTALKKSVIDLESYTAKLQYEARTLDSKLREVEEAAMSFASKVDDLEERMLNFGSRDTVTSSNLRAYINSTNTDKTTLSLQDNKHDKYPTQQGRRLSVSRKLKGKLSNTHKKNSSNYSEIETNESLSPPKSKTNLFTNAWNYFWGAKPDIGNNSNSNDNNNSVLDHDEEYEESDYNTDSDAFLTSASVTPMASPIISHVSSPVSMGHNNHHYHAGHNSEKSPSPSFSIGQAATSKKNPSRRKIHRANSASTTATMPNFRRLSNVQGDFKRSSSPSKPLAMKKGLTPANGDGISKENGSFLSVDKAEEGADSCAVVTDDEEI